MIFLLHLPRNRDAGINKWIVLVMIGKVPAIIGWCDPSVLFKNPDKVLLVSKVAVLTNLVNWQVGFHQQDLCGLNL